MRTELHKIKQLFIFLNNILRKKINHLFKAEPEQRAHLLHVNITALVRASIKVLCDKM